MEIEQAPYQQLITHIGGLLESGRQLAVQSVNTILVETYWRIGKYIVEFEQQGNIKSEYGKQLLDNLSNLNLLQKFFKPIQSA